MAPPPNNTFSVLTTLSFAVNPVINAVDALQSPNPNGANIGAIAPPIIASMLSPASFTKLKCMSNVCRNHIIIEAKNIIVNALVIKSFALSHINLKTLLAPGNL